jgi:hypothetical protein
MRFRGLVQLSLLASPHTEGMVNGRGAGEEVLDPTTSLPVTHRAKRVKSRSGLDARSDWHEG